MTLLEFKMCLRHCSYCVACCREWDKEVTMNIAKLAALSNSSMFLRVKICAQNTFKQDLDLINLWSNGWSVSVHESRKIKSL